MNPYALVDSYVGTLSPTERETFWASAQQCGLRETLLSVQLPSETANQPAHGGLAQNPQAQLAADNSQTARDVRAVAHQPGAYSRDLHQGFCAVCHGK